MKKIVIVLSSLVLLVLIAGVYKFNFTDDDIIIPLETTGENNTPPTENTPSIQVKDIEDTPQPKMTLGMKTWIWTSTQYSDDKIVKPLKENKFTLTINKDNTFSATTDCNNIGGEYTTKDNQIAFSKMMSTKMYCEGSQEADFAKMLNETQNYLFTEKGELALTLRYDSGSILFK